MKLWNEEKTFEFMSVLHSIAYFLWLANSLDSSLLTQRCDIAEWPVQMHCESMVRLRGHQDAQNSQIIYLFNAVYHKNNNWGKVICPGMNGNIASFEVFIWGCIIIDWNVCILNHFKNLYYKLIDDWFELKLFSFCFFIVNTK